MCSLLVFGLLLMGSIWGLFFVMGLRLQYLLSSPNKKAVYAITHQFAPGGDWRPAALPCALALYIWRFSGNNLCTQLRIQFLQLFWLVYGLCCCFCCNWSALNGRKSALSICPGALLIAVVLLFSMAISAHANADTKTFFANNHQLSLKKRISYLGALCVTGLFWAEPFNFCV